MAESTEKAPTEQEMREQKVPWFKTQDELREYIDKLVAMPHDYGTVVYAMSMAATAAMQYVASTLGATGFQASCADLDIVRRTRLLDGPFRITDYSKLLYPQYLNAEHFPTIGDLEADADLRQWLADAARKKLADPDIDKAHAEVVARWRYCAALAPAKPTTKPSERVVGDQA